MGTRNRKNAAAAALCTGVIGNVIWGSSYLFTRIAQNESSPMVQLAWRFALAFLLIFFAKAMAFIIQTAPFPVLCWLLSPLLPSVWER